MSEIWFMKTFNKVKTACKIPQLINGSFYFNGEYLQPASKTWTEFLTLTPADVRDQASVYVYDKQCLFIWNALAVRWFHAGGVLRFPTFAAATLAIGVGAKWEDTEFYCDDVAGGNLKLKHNGSRFVPTSAQGYLFNEVNGTLASPTKTIPNGAAPQGWTFNNPKIPGGLVQAGDTLWAEFSGQRHGTGAQTLVMALGTSSAITDLTDAQFYSQNLATTDLAKVEGVCKLIVGANTSMSTNGSNSIQQTSGSGAGTRSSVTANLDFTADQYFKGGLTVRGTTTETVDLLQFSCLWIPAS